MRSRQRAVSSPAGTAKSAATKALVGDEALAALSLTVPFLATG
jgi:hypothetical protein